MGNKIDIKKVSQVWNYFKKGRREVGVILGLFSIIITYSIKFNIDFTITQYLIFTGVFGVSCTFLGVFLAKKVDPEQARISPLSQDNIKCNLDFQQSLVYWYEGDKEKAIETMQKAIKRKRKWLR